jgi:hypothetical protein
MNVRRLAMPVLMALLGLAALHDLARLGSALPWRQLYEFREFYCAGAALDRSADPYRYEPLHRCEHAVDQIPAFRADPWRVIPAPLPPYDFAPYMLAARVSFPAARTVAAIAIALTVITTIWVLSLGAIPIEVAALALALPGGFVLLTAGQIVPFALLILVLCGLALSRQREQLAGTLAALTLIEPHLGLPVCVAMLAWVPRSRPGLAATALILASVGILIVGAGGIVEFVTRVVPAQAAAETGYVYQYSLTYLLRTIGVPPATALVLGDASYIAMLLLGVWLGGRVAERLDRRELIAYLPAACSVIGGPYIHMVDIPFAIPAALVLAASLHGRPKAIAAVALCLLAIPWIPVWIIKRLFLASLFVVAALLLRLRAPRAVAIATFVSVALAIYLIELFPPAPFAGTTPAFFTAGDLADSAWHALVDQLFAASQNPLWLAVKIPSWLALLATLGAAFVAVRPERQTNTRGA